MEEKKCTDENLDDEVVILADKTGKMEEKKCTDENLDDEVVILADKTEDANKIIEIECDSDNSSSSDDEPSGDPLFAKIVRGAKLSVIRANRIDYRNKSLGDKLVKSYIGDCISTPAPVKKEIVSSDDEEDKNEMKLAEESVDVKPIEQLRANVESSWNKVNEIAKRCGETPVNEGFVIDRGSQNEKDVCDDETEAEPSIPPVGTSDALAYRQSCVSISSDSSTSESSDETSDDSPFPVREHESTDGEGSFHRDLRPAMPRTKGELTIEDLPPIEHLQVTIAEDQPLMLLGQVTSIVGTLVVIQSNKDEATLDADSVLFLENKETFGLVFETFGPVAAPLYSVRFNNVEEIEEKDVKSGMKIYYAPKLKEWTKYVFAYQLQKFAGSDASWKNNNEPPAEVLDYSDDEQEQLARRGRRQAKRENNNNKDDEDGDAIVVTDDESEEAKNKNINSQKKPNAKKKRKKNNRNKATAGNNPNDNGQQSQSSQNTWNQPLPKGPVARHPWSDQNSQKAWKNQQNFAQQNMPTFPPYRQNYIQRNTMPPYTTERPPQPVTSISSFPPGAENTAIDHTDSNMLSSNPSMFHTDTNRMATPFGQPPLAFNNPSSQSQMPFTQGPPPSLTPSPIPTFNVPQNFGNNRAMQSFSDIDPTNIQTDIYNTRDPGCSFSRPLYGRGTSNTTARITSPIPNRYTPSPMSQSVNQPPTNHLGSQNQTAMNPPSMSQNQPPFRDPAQFNFTQTQPPPPGVPNSFAIDNRPSRAPPGFELTRPPPGFPPQPPPVDNWGCPPSIPQPTDNPAPNSSMFGFGNQTSFSGNSATSSVWSQSEPRNQTWTDPFKTQQGTSPFNNSTTNFGSNPPF